MSSVIVCPVCRSRHLPRQEHVKNGVFAAICENCGHFFKFRVNNSVTSSITLKVNGKQYTASSDAFDSGTTLVSFLRAEVGMGTKYMCLEGGCGVCTVQAKLYDPLTDMHQSYSINSCLCPLYQCDGWDITTIEGVSQDIPQRLVDYNGSQCGFCSPAQVMNMHALLEKNKDNVTMEQVENAFDSVVCRCTGYRPILDAMKSFAQDGPLWKNKQCKVDIEDLGKICKTTGKLCAGACLTLPLKEPQGQMKVTLLGDTQWFRPTTVDQVFDAMQSAHGKSMKLVFGNTGFGIYQDLGHWNYQVLVDLRGIQDLYTVSEGPDLLIGAGVSLFQLTEIFERVKEGNGFHFCEDFLYRTNHLASHTVRNLASWGGNMMMKYAHHDFPSDMYNMLEAANAKLLISSKTVSQETVAIRDFLGHDMTNKLLLGVIIPADEDPNLFIQTYKVGKREQFCHAYVNGGFRLRCDKSNNFIVKEKPSIVFGGMSDKFIHASATENYLTGKSLSDPNIVKDAIAVLASEAIADGNDVTLASPDYRKNLAVVYLYKFVLYVLGDQATEQFRSAATTLPRSLMSGVQTFDTKPLEWPLTEPVSKLSGLLQTTGKANYIFDSPTQQKELSACFVRSTVANATIFYIDPSEALKMPGVIKFITAADIPGTNSIYPYAGTDILPLVLIQELLCSGTVSYMGQPIGIIVVDGGYFAAKAAASAVKVHYNNVQSPILTIDDAINHNSFHKKPCDDMVVGDADDAIARSAHQISGVVSCSDQCHFQMETQIAISTPTEDGMEVEASTQWTDFTQIAIATVLGCYENTVTVKVKRLGGSYGSKITGNFAVSAASALAAHLTNRPVRMRMDFHEEMENFGKRFPFRAEYQVGTTADGMLNGIKIKYYGDCGYLPNDNSIEFVFGWADNAYNCANWHLEGVACKTNKPMNTACRSPGSCPAIYITEYIMEHVAKVLHMDSLALKQLNMYNKGQTSLTKQVLEYCNIKDLMTQLTTEADYSTRQNQVAAFNAANRWQKKGLSVVPMKFGIAWTGALFATMVDVFYGDGSVSVTHGGVESGQGINTKVIQVCAYKLGIPLDMVQIKTKNSNINPNNTTTGGSITSELVCQGVAQCCDTLLTRMAPAKAKLKNPTWKDIVVQCMIDGIDLQTTIFPKPDQSDDKVFKYFSYGVTCTEVLLDVLTGQYQIERVDILFDCGESMNPVIDVGQVEGAFVMGLGYHLTEELVYDPLSGQLATNGTWEYKPPFPKDIPMDFRVHLLKNAPNPLGILRSKACGEPPLCMSCSALFALKNAIYAAREDAGIDGYIPQVSPLTVEKVQMACKVTTNQLVFT